MLRNLHVKNLALIQEVDVDFSEGLNILTGETGAGKSIIIDSITLALGGKMSRDMIREQAPFALVELLFEITNPSIEQKLKEMDIYPEDGVVLISRKIMDGRSVSKINGETCTVSQVRKAAGLLLDIHGQHEHQSLLHNEKQLDILDEYGKEEILFLKKSVSEAYSSYEKLRRKLRESTMDEEERKRRMDFLEYEIREIEQANLQNGEDEELEKLYRKLVNGKKIVENIQEVHELTGYESGQGAGEQIGRALRAIASVEEYDPEIGSLSSMLADIDNLLNDFNREVSTYLSDLTFSEEDFIKTESRLDEINRLKAKYGNTLEQVLCYLKDSREELNGLVDYENNRREMELDFREKEIILRGWSEKLSKKRVEYSKKLASEIEGQLTDLNFLHVDFQIELSDSGHFSANGTDQVEFMISTNPGEVRKPLNRVVSGGELSRIMLAIKTLLAQQDETPTLIFDEIDTGISGRTAQKVSEKLSLVGLHHQVMCITHLPQIAAMADVHYGIEKSVKNGNTVTTIEPLNEEEKTRELARMLGGAQITDRTLESAREMKDLAREQKNTRLK
ncbi:MAG: DNA repair protein RecN [Lachnospiraceae bacterium]|nr:DNA repair protein RecN [Lachnospiraceae bacterium]